MVNGQMSRSQVKKVIVIDGQGGGIGAALIKGIREAYGETIEILALGTNAMATSQMVKARANRGATGENAIVQTAKQADLIIGPVSITWANAMMGEVTPRIAEAVTSSPAHKLLLPLFKENVTLVGFNEEPLPHLMEVMINKKMKELLSHV